MVKPYPLSLSERNVLTVVLLNPYFSSITNVPYIENGRLMMSFRINNIPKNIRPEVMV